MAQYRPLKESEIRELENRNCRAAVWGRVLVTEPFDASRVRNTVFCGDVRLGSLAGTAKCGTVDQRCGVYDAVLADTTIGDGCLIRGVRSRLAGYDIEDGAV
ncbi:MAG: DUF4954 family protein, partial [Planctomycetota bacterium]|nr:DUF4954 family protein [Planctomycetota bacterium]